MLQNPAAKAEPLHHESPSADLSRIDLFYAFLLHLLIIIVAVVITYWQSHRQDEPLQRIEVMMISAKQLSNIEQKARRKARPAKQRSAKPKAVKKTKIEAKKPPVLKLEKRQRAKTRKKTVSRAKAKVATKKADRNFDPFAPVASTTDRSAESTRQASTSRPDIANLMGQQLSRNEIERYIALMQAAVQEQWKVAASSGKVSDPLVEMELAPNGSVVSVKILESSGNELMDNSLVRAIHAATPFQLPKAQFEYFRLNKIRFHPLK